MAKIVDDQNKGDPEYEKMSVNFDKSVAFKTALKTNAYQGMYSSDQKEGENRP